jgi:hypothetical protein
MTKKILTLYLVGFLIYTTALITEILVKLTANPDQSSKPSGFFAILRTVCQHPANLFWIIWSACVIWSSNGRVLNGKNIDHVEFGIISQEEIVSYDAMLMPGSLKFLNFMVWTFVIIYGCFGVFCFACLISCNELRKDLVENFDKPL